MTITEEYDDAFEEMKEMFQSPPTVLGDILLGELAACRDICEEYDVPGDNRVNLICESYRHAHYDIVDGDIEAIRIQVEEVFA